MSYSSEDPGATQLVAADVAARVLSLRAERDRSWAIISVERNNGDVDVLDFTAAPGDVEAINDLIDDELARDCIEAFFEASSPDVSGENLGFEPETD